jgi:hypothetical protein
MIVEFLTITVPTVGLGAATYQDANKGKPREQWPHRVAMTVTREGCVFCVWLIRHHGRWVAWQVAQLLPKRRMGGNKN